MLKLILGLTVSNSCAFDPSSFNLITLPWKVWNIWGSPSAGPTWFQLYWEPCVQCCNRERIGKIGDGGKWVCIGNVRQNPVLISVGSNNEFSFESSILKKYPAAIVNTYDHTSYPSDDPKIHFHKTMMTPDLLFSLVRNSQEPIDILKVDCEGCEYDLFSNHILLKKLCAMNTQILIEVHWSKLGQQKMAILWEKFTIAGFGPFHKEPNIQWTDGSCVEYSLKPIPTATCLKRHWKLH